MSYWKGLMYALAIDLVWIMGCPFLATEPAPQPPVQEVRRPAQPGRELATLEHLNELGRLEDSLMAYLQDHADDVSAMESLARAYLDNEWYEAALGPLARALELDPSRRSLWVSLDAAIEKSGRVKITDAELTRKALEFKQAVEMWGMGC